MKRIGNFLLDILTFGKHSKLMRIRAESEMVIDHVYDYIKQCEDHTYIVEYYQKVNLLLDIPLENTSYNSMIDHFKKRIVFVEQNFPEIPMIRARIRDKRIDDLLQ